MKTIITASLVFTFLLPLNLIFAEWLPGYSSISQSFDKKSDKSILMLGEFEFEASITIPGMELAADGEYYRLICPGLNEIEGDPVITGFINLPPTAAPVITIISADYEVYNINDNLPLVSDLSDLPVSAVEFPAGFVNIGQPSILRDLRIAPIHIFPYKYDSLSGELVVTRSVNFRISFETDDNPVNSKTSFRPHSSAFKDLYRSTVWNYVEDSTDEYIAPNYVIICPDNFVTFVQDLVIWKNQKGIHTTLVPFSQIGATSYNAAVIKNYLAYIYSTSEYPPDYVLLVGDQTVLPVHSTYTPDPVTYFSSYSLPGDYINENYYACLEGDDYLPEVYLGRLVANSPTYIMLLVNKVIKYEKTPNVGQTDWYTKAIMTSDQSEASQRQTKLTVRNILLNDGGFTQVDTLFEIGYISQFINWVNQGRSVVNYRGAGWDNIWSGIGLSAYNLSNLTNYNMLPMVTGIGCGGALFSSYCLGEAWMNQGTINNPTGAVLFIGPTWNTHTNFNNRLDLGIYEHMWQDSLREIGPAFMEGKMDVEAFFSLYYGIPGYGDVQEVVRTLFNQYMLMSDPNITVRAQPPRTMMVEHTTEVYLGPGEIEISVTDDLGNPLEGLVASAYISGETFSAELTDVNGEALLNINPQSRPNQLYITVTGLDYNPYYTNLEVMANSQFVSHYEYEIDDGPGGDGIVSPGETIDLTETVKNYGIAAAYNVNGLLSSPASALVIINDSSFFGDIPVEMTATGSQSYTFTLPSDYSLSELPLTLDISDNAGYQWQSDLTIQVKMPSLAYEGFIVNGSLNRGDIADIIVSMGNIGTLAAVNLTGTLESLDPEVIVMEDESDYDLINPGQILNNSGDPFQIQISYYCPTYFDAHFRFTIEGDQGTFNLHEEYEFEIEVSEPGQIDPGFDNAGIYYAYEMSDSIYSQAPEYWRDDMASLASRTGIVIEMDPETQIAYLEFPPDFTWRYYGQDYDILSISADGFIAPGEVPYTTSSNYGIPRSDQIEGMVAPLWYDMYCLVAEPGEISYYFDPEGRLIIEYYNWSHANTNMMTETFQIVIYDPETMPTLSGDSVIEFYYGEVTYEALWNSTCGIEAPSQTDGIEMWQNTSYPITTHPPEPYSVIRFTSDPPVVDIITSIYPKGGVSLTPLHLELEQNFPNPFNPATNIRYRIADKGAVKLAVYNIMGEEVAELVDSYLEAGEYTAVWKADSKPSGIYFIRLVSDDKIISRKALLLK